jgi:transcriptional regulator with XRE-family HTH domain
MDSKSNNLGKILKQQRLSIPLTLRELSTKSKVSSSHLGRIERGERFPSARILHKIASPLGFQEQELLTLAGYLSPAEASKETEEGAPGRLDPIVAKMLAQEPVEVQRAVIGILSVLKGIAKGIT